MKSKSLNVAIFYGLSITAVIFALISVLRRLNIGYGLTDEAFSISHTQERLQIGSMATSWLYADLTSPLMRISGEKITSFRLISLLVLIGVCLIAFIPSMLEGKSLGFRNKSLQAATILTIALLTIPSSFRYLLVTPTYQWIILTASSALAILLCIETRADTKLRMLLVPVYSLLIIFIAMSRLTSGIAALLLVILTTSLTDRNLRRIPLLILLLITGGGAYLWAWPSTGTKILSSIDLARTIDPNGRNIFTEGLDVAAPSLIIIFVLLAPAAIYDFAERKRDSSKRIERSLKLVYAVIVVGLILGLMPDKRYIPFLIISIAIGIHTRIRPLNLDTIRLVFISLLPVVSQFGSNISASYLIPPLIICSCIYLYGASLSTIHNNKMQSVAFLSIIVVMMLFGNNQNWNESYENSINSNRNVVDSESGLKFSSEKFSAIVEFRNKIKSGNIETHQRVFDLSFWHPGAILYIGQKPMPYFIGDKVYIDTIDQQVSLAVKGNKAFLSNDNYSMLIETTRTKVDNKCSYLIELIEDSALRAALLKSSFNPSAKVTAVYKSSKEDSTLYPKNLAYLTRCNQ
jgi:hypothetical protein